MLKKFNKFMLITMLFSIMLCLMGIILIIYPDISLKVIALIIAVSMIVGGLFLIIDFGGRILFTNFMTIGILLFIMGNITYSTKYSSNNYSIYSRYIYNY